MFGGSAGGGKSDALLMAALMFCEIAGYSALLLRKTYADLSLPGAIMDRAHEWLGPTAARWNDREKTWAFPSGATLTFGYLDSANDHYRYQSSEFQYIGFDELTQFPETHYRYLFSRLRRLEGARVPLRMRAASNPGGIGHDWVRARFVDAPNPERAFIPASLSDNPHLDAGEYRASLAELDHLTRAQLLHGDWTARPEGGLFKREWFEIVDESPARARRVRYWDMAATEAKQGTDPDWTVGVRVALAEGIYYVEDVRRVRATPQATENLVRQTAELDGTGVSIYMEQEPGSAGVGVIDHFRRRVLVGFPFRGHKTTGPKEVRANPVSAAAEAGNVKLVRGGWISSYLDEMGAFPQGSHDDQVDGTSGAVATLSGRGGLRVTPRPAGL